MKNKLLLIFYIILFIILLLSILRYNNVFTIKVGKMPTTSMEPTITKNDLVIYKTNSYESISDVKVMDIVVCKISNAGALNGMLMVKRIIGLPLDEITFQDNNFCHIKTKSLPFNLILDFDKKKDYMIDSKSFKSKTYKVPEKSFFVIGDNFKKSTGSHLFGAVKFSDIIGKVIDTQEIKK